MQKMLGLVWLLACVILASGCSTYINIPPQDGDLAQHSPNGATVRLVVSEALHAVVQQYPFDGSYAVLLPEDTTAQTYSEVVSRINDGAVWPGNKDRSDLPIIEVKNIRVRGQDARVDIVWPGEADEEHADPQPQAVTVSMHWHPFKGWVSQRVRVWRLPIEEALRLTLGDLGHR